MSIKSVLRKIRNSVIPAKVVKVTVATSASSNMLNNHVILITGGGSGIGKSVAESVVRQGARAIILGRRKERIESICNTIGNDKCKYYQADITKIDNYQKMFCELEGMFEKPVTGLVNNAGVYINKGLFDFSTDDFDQIFEINLKATIFLIREYIAYTESNKYRANIVVTSSNRGFFGDTGPYGLSKCAVNSFIEGVARTYITRGIRINGVAPGMTASEINHIDVNGNMYTSSTKGERVIHPDEIAEVITFLLSNNSQCITGAIIPCDDGDRLR
jgi:Dehydrogenases with different specificities (related to short-chain alcohol dehydrogenases)